MSTIPIEYSIKKKIKTTEENCYENCDENCDENTEEILSKFDILVINKGWNSKNENFIVSIGENAAAFKYMHDKISHRYIIYDAILKISIAILGVLLSADSFFNTQYIIFKQTILFILAIVGVINNFLDYGKSSIEHKHSSYLFSILYHDIQNVMCMYKKERPNAIKYIQHSIKQYDHLEVTGPDIPKSTLEQFKKSINDTKSTNDIVNKIQKIDIITEPNSSFIINNRHNLSNIQDAFSIKGDLCEKDNLSLNDYNRVRGLNIQSEYEMNRLYSHV